MFQLWAATVGVYRSPPDLSGISWSSPAVERLGPDMVLSRHYFCGLEFLKSASL